MTKYIQIAAAFAGCFISLPSQGAQTGKNATDNNIRFFQWKVSQDPDDLFNYDRLGVAYIQKARETGDVAWYDLATKALESALALDSTSPEAAPSKKHLATVDYANHRFGEALALAQDAIQLNPSDITAYALIGDAFSEKGDYAEASAAWGRLKDQGAPRAAVSGIQYLRETRQSVESLLTGDTKAAIGHMRRAAELSAESRMAAETIAWSYFTLGDDYFQAGDLASAKAAYGEALKAYPGYHRALAGSARVAAAEGRFNDSIALYQKALGVIPLPVYAAALGDVYAAEGKTTEARKQYDLVEYIGRLNNFNRTIYNRELAAFYADHDIRPKESLDLARKEFDIRHDIYTWDTLAWALYRNDSLAEAASAIGEALRFNTEDASLFFHAGMIYARLGDKDKAGNYLRHALELNPQFHLLHAKTARETLKTLSGSTVTQATLRTVDAGH